MKMKPMERLRRLLAFYLVLVVILPGCGAPSVANVTTEETTAIQTEPERDWLDSMVAYDNRVAAHANALEEANIDIQIVMDNWINSDGDIGVQLYCGAAIRVIDDWLLYDQYVPEAFEDFHEAYTDAMVDFRRSYSRLMDGAASDGEARAAMMDEAEYHFSEGLKDYRMSEYFYGKVVWEE